MPGYENSTATLISLESDDLIASTENLEHRTVDISLAARDTGHPDGSTHLRRGLLLGKLTASDLYIEFDNGAADGSEVEADAVILAVQVRDMDLKSGSHAVAAVYYTGTFFKAKIFVTGAAPVWDDVQRLRRV